MSHGREGHGQFVQHIRFKTSNINEVMLLMQQYDSSSAAGAPDAWVMRDRDRPNTYLASVVFETYEAAMKNNDLPQTQEFAEKMQALCDGPAEFFNYDLIAEDI